MTRLASLDDNMFDTTIEEILAGIKEIKGRQIVGKSSLRPRILQTAKKMDISSVNDFGSHQISLQINFTADHQANPYARPYVQLFDLKGNPVSFSILTNFSISVLNNPVGINYSNFFIDDGIVQLQVFMTSTPTLAFAAKAFLQASDSGTMELLSFAGTLL
jgi:hypothetical protein